MPVTAPATPSSATHVSLDAVRHRRRANFLLVFAAWNVWVWVTRLVNLLQDDPGSRSTAFLTVHAVLFVGGVGGAAVLATMGLRMRREASTSASPSAEAAR